MPLIVYIYSRYHGNRDINSHEYVLQCCQKNPRSAGARLFSSHFRRRIWDWNIEWISILMLSPWGKKVLPLKHILGNDEGKRQLKNPPIIFLPIWHSFEGFSRENVRSNFMQNVPNAIIENQEFWYKSIIEMKFCW